MSEYVHKISEEETERIRRFLHGLAVGVVVFVLLVVALFVTADSWLKLISPESERRFIEPYIEWSRGKLLVQADDELQDYVASLTNEIYSLLGDEQELRVQVIEGDTLNAFATLGGYIFVFEGLIDAVDNENALAMMLAHEIAHVHHRDPLLSTGRAMLIQLAISTLSGSSIDPNSVDSSSDVLLNQYSRDQELMADELALTLLQRRYGHVGGATTLFELIEDDSPESIEFLSTHPDTGARIDKIETLTTEKGWDTDSPTPYPDAVRAALAD
ncbi:MAG: M48 family metallopeptidase [Woeseiaceae bacterium]|nr:M48 family metallopeptidase [Woeseiaceae bacterium]